MTKMRQGRMENLKLQLFTVMVSLICHHVGTSSAALDIAGILDPYPEFSLLSQLLTLTDVTDEINAKTGLTLFAPPNSVLSSFQAGLSNTFIMADILRHHVATEYLNFTELQDLSSELSVSTLLRTTTDPDPDAVIISKDELGTVLINNTIKTTVVSSISQLEQEISIIKIDQVLRPVNYPPQPPTSSAPLNPLNITRTLSTLDDFSIFRRYLEETGVDSLFEGRQETEAGCVILAPSDAAFKSLSGNWFQKLSKNDRMLFLEYHSINRFFSLLDLWKLVEFPVETIASTLTSGESSFILEINSTARSGIVNIRAGQSNATITSTLYESNPIVMFGIDTVLLPRELFGDDFIFAPSSNAPVESPAPVTPSPSLPDADFDSGSSHTSRSPQAPPPVNSDGGRRSTATAFGSMALLLLSSSLGLALQVP